MTTVSVRPSASRGRKKGRMAQLLVALLGELVGDGGLAGSQDEQLADSVASLDYVSF